VRNKIRVGLIVLAGIFGVSLTLWLVSQALGPIYFEYVSEIPMRMATETEILNDQPADVDVFRFDYNPNILVLTFATLQAQGHMLNRVAGLVEKAGLPPDRVATNPELNAAIKAEGVTEDTFYYGHDYSIVDLVRFFALASRDHVALTKEEEWLRALLRQVGWMQTSTLGAVISIPGPDAPTDVMMRAAILRHELAHGEYFSNRQYAAFVSRFWMTALTEHERSLFRAYLAAIGYRISNEDLVINEMQAYLIYTPDSRLFTPGVLGLSEGRSVSLRTMFLNDMPHGWLLCLRPDAPAVECRFPLEVRP